MAPFSWSSWVPGYSDAIIHTISFRTRTINDKPSISAWQMWATDGRFNGVGVHVYQELEEHVLRLSPGEKITSCTIWMNIVPAYMHDACVGRVRLLTDRGQVLDTAPNDRTLGTGLSRPVGVGLLCGALGNQSRYATKTLCLLFLTSTMMDQFIPTFMGQSPPTFMEQTPSIITRPIRPTIVEQTTPNIARQTTPTITKQKKPTATRQTTPTMATTQRRRAINWDLVYA